MAMMRNPATMHPLVLRAVHAMRQRALWWDEMSDDCRRMIDAAVDGCMKECVEIGLAREAREAAWAVREPFGEEAWR